MTWMNSLDVDDARERYRDHPFLGPATATLESLRDATNRNSDGWAYWQPPSRAASKLMDLIEGRGLDPRVVRFDHERKDVTYAKLRAAYAPLKAFRTKMKNPPAKYGTGLDGRGIKFEFDIVEVSPDGAPLIFQEAK